MSSDFDREKTQLQENGDLFIAGMSLADVWVVVQGLGIDPRNTSFRGSAYICAEPPLAARSPSRTEKDCQQ